MYIIKIALCGEYYSIIATGKCLDCSFKAVFKALKSYTKLLNNHLIVNYNEKTNFNVKFTLFNSPASLNLYVTFKSRWKVSRIALQDY